MTIQKNNANRWIIELGVIVGTILLAFSIEAWWSDRNERANEIALLQSLHEDLIEKRDWLDFSKRYNQVILDSATTLLQASQMPNPEITAEEMNLHMFNLLWYNTEGDWVSAPLDTLIGGGNATIISNQALLQALVRIQAAFDLLKGFSRTDTNYRFDTLTPFLIENAHMLHMNLAGEHAPADPARIWPFPNIQTEEQYDHRDLLFSIEFQNILAVEINRKLDILTNGHRDIDDRFEITLSLLEEELDYR